MLVAGTAPRGSEKVPAEGHMAYDVGFLAGGEKFVKVYFFVLFWVCLFCGGVGQTDAPHKQTTSLAGTL